jgi:hypothetical protein
VSAKRSMTTKAPPSPMPPRNQQWPGVPGRSIEGQRQAHDHRDGVNAVPGCCRVVPHARNQGPWTRDSWLPHSSPPDEPPRAHCSVDRHCSAAFPRAQRRPGLPLGRLPCQAMTSRAGVVVNRAASLISVATATAASAQDTPGMALVEALAARRTRNKQTVDVAAA